MRIDWGIYGLIAIAIAVVAWVGLAALVVHDYAVCADWVDGSKEITAVTGEKVQVGRRICIKLNPGRRVEELDERYR